jgi:hypothetical protein
VRRLRWARNAHTVAIFSRPTEKYFGKSFQLKFQNQYPRQQCCRTTGRWARITRSRKRFLHKNLFSYPAQSTKTAGRKRPSTAKAVDSTIMGLGAYWTVQGSPGFRVLVSQGESYQPPHRHGMNDVFAFSERFQGLELFVRKPDRKPSSLHGLCIYDEGII